MSCIHQHDEGEIAHCAFLIKVGTRDEVDGQEGISHFIEHAIFKGTSKRKSFHILNRLEVVGGEINAYTTKEYTCVHASFLKEYYDRAIELLSDILFNSTFPVKEMDLEREIIIDEIDSYLDSPIDQIYDDFENLVFDSHPLGKAILGTKESLRGIHQKQLLDFYNKFYVPENIIFSSIGNIELNKLKKSLDKHIPNKSSENIERTDQNIKNKSAAITLDKPIHQAHVILGTYAYNIKDERRHLLILLMNILGGPSLNSRLNWELREKNGIAYNIEANYTPYSDTGIVTFYFGTEKELIEKGRRITVKEFGKLRNKRLGTVQLHNAKKQILGQLALAFDSKSSWMLSNGKSLMNYGKVDSMNRFRTKIDSIKAEELLEIANEILDENNMSSLIYQPI